MELNFNNLLLRTAFSCMACDGEIAPEEVALMKNMAIEKNINKSSTDTMRNNTI